MSVSAAEQGVAEDPVKLTVTGISKSFGGVQAVKDISLTVLEGMFFAAVFLQRSTRPMNAVCSHNMTIPSYTTSRDPAARRPP